ncbi:MAG: hypothetical protein K0R85_2068 [Devosia sp.]|nr:hypothetical protein [Devosia sp.]
MAPSESLRALARFVGHFAANGGGKELGFVDDDEDGIPMVAIGVEHAAEKSRSGAHLLLDIEAFEVEHDRNAVLANAAGNAGELGLGASGINHDMAELVGKRDEIALGIDDALLHPGGALLEQATQQVGFARAGIALDEEARGEEFLEIEQGTSLGNAGASGAHVDLNLHSCSG